MRTFTTPICSALSVFLLAASASGEMRYVSSEGSAESPFTSWKTAARDIASALDIADDGDQIVVAAGTYPIGRTIVVNRAVALRSADGAGKAVLDGKDSARDGWCFDVQSDRAIIDGFTITRFGGGVRFSHREGTTAVVRNCVIVRNAGHGIFFNHGGCAKNCTVAYNDGAGLYAYDMGGGGDDPANLILFGNEQGFVRQSANISLHNSCTDDPRFVSDKDFRLRPDSPCIDAGRNEDWMIDAVDAAGRPRIQNKVVDVGAYEFEASKLHVNQPLKETGPISELIGQPEPNVNGCVSPLTADLAKNAVDHFLAELKEIERVAALRKAEAKARLDMSLQQLQQFETETGERYHGMLGSYFNPIFVYESELKTFRNDLSLGVEMRETSRWTREDNEIK